MKKTIIKVHSVEVLSQKLSVKSASDKQGSLGQAQGFYVV
jgi:hypothetical protein